MTKKIQSLVVMVTLMALSLSGLFVYGSASASAHSVKATVKVCPAMTGHFSMKLPPKGFAVTIESHVLANCTLVETPAQVVSISQLAAKLGNTGISHGKSLSPSYWSGTTAYVAQRSWDCCGIMMNALYTTLGWNYTGSGVYPYSTYNKTSYHPEYGPAGPGWWLGYQNLYYSGGCNGCWQSSLTGNAGFPYRGSFDPSGTIYYNSYSNTMTGYGNGGWSCSGSYSWRWSLAGWSHQSWCTYGQDNRRKAGSGV